MSRTIALLLALVLSLTGLGTVAGSASAAPGDGSISGTVTNTAGQPLAGVWVHATYQTSESGDRAIYKEIQTDSLCRYTLGPLSAQT